MTQVLKKKNFTQYKYCYMVKKWRFRYCTILEMVWFCYRTRKTLAILHQELWIFNFHEIKSFEIGRCNFIRWLGVTPHNTKGRRPEESENSLCHYYFLCNFVKFSEEIFCKTQKISCLCYAHISVIKVNVLEC